MLATALTVVQAETPASAAIGDITTVAGNGTYRRFSGDGGPATAAAVEGVDVAADQSGNLFIADFFNYRIRRVDAVSHIITTVAGNGNPDVSGDGGPATSAGVGNPRNLVVDARGNLFFTGFRAASAFGSGDGVNQGIRKVDAATGIISTYAGRSVRTGGFSGDGGPASSAELDGPRGLAVDAAGNLLVGDSNNHRVRRVDAVSNVITTVAGAGSDGFSGDGGPAISARLSYPVLVALDSAGNLFIGGGYRIRRVDAATQAITSVAGTGAYTYTPGGDGGPATAADIGVPGGGLAVGPAGDLFMGYGNRVRKIDAGTQIITTVVGDAGPGGFTGDGGPASMAKLGGVAGVAIDRFGNLFIADEGNARVRVVDGGALPPPTVTEVSPARGPAPGGTAVTITGTGFSTSPGATAVSFGASPATGVSCSTSSTCMATSPAGAGVVDVTVSVGGKTSPTGPADRFTYVPAPQISGLSPGCGPTMGGTAVTVTGSGFAGASAVTFGSTPSGSFTVVSDSTMTAVSPASSAGSTAVTVTTPSGTSVPAGQTFASPCPPPTTDNGGPGPPAGANGSPQQPGSLAGPGGGGAPAPAPAPGPATAPAAAPGPAPASAAAPGPAPVAASAAAPVPVPVVAPAPGGMQAPGQVQAPGQAPVQVVGPVGQGAVSPAVATGRQGAPEGAADYAMVRVSTRDVPGGVPLVAAGAGLVVVGGVVVDRRRRRVRPCLALPRNARP